MPNGCSLPRAPARRRRRTRKCRRRKFHIRMKTGSERQRAVSSEQRAGMVVTACCLLLTAHALFGADFQVSASLDRNQIALNEQAVLSVTVSGSGNDLPQPQLP